jgi:hypothetical protein
MNRKSGRIVMDRDASEHPSQLVTNPFVNGNGTNNKNIVE